jgi:hypothetical protein
VNAAPPTSRTPGAAIANASAVRGNLRRVKAGGNRHTAHSTAAEKINATNAKRWMSADELSSGDRGSPSANAATTKEMIAVARPAMRTCRRMRTSVSRPSITANASPAPIRSR